METAEREKNEKSNHDSWNFVSSTLSLPPHSSKQKAKKMPAYGQVQGAFMPFFYSCALLINYDDVAAL